MTRTSTLTALLLAACAPTIPLLAPGAVGPPLAPLPDDAPPVTACLLVAERFERPLWNAVERDEGKTWDFMIGSIVVTHPRATFVIDPTFAKTVGADLDTAGGVAKALLGDGSTKTSLADLFARAGLDPSTISFALATHTHWDHVGGLDALPAASLLIPEAERAFDATLTAFFDHGVMTRYLTDHADRVKTYAFDGPARDGFPASHDVLGDGTVVALPLPGHTPGSVAILLRANGRNFLLSGDTTWSYRGVEAPAHKHGLVRSVDFDVETNSRSIGLLHALATGRPDLTVVPAHDGARMALFPLCGAK